MQSLWVHSSNKELEFDTLMLLPDPAGGLNPDVVHADSQQLASELVFKLPLPTTVIYNEHSRQIFFSVF